MPKYAEKIPQNVLQNIKDIAPQLDLVVLLPLMKECLQRHLSEGSGYIGPEVPIWDVLDVCTVPGVGSLGKVEWFKKSFPRNVECRYFLQMYKFLSTK